MEIMVIKLVSLGDTGCNKYNNNGIMIETFSAMHNGAIVCNKYDNNGAISETFAPVNNKGIAYHKYDVLYHYLVQQLINILNMNILVLMLLF